MFYRTERLKRYIVMMMHATVIIWYSTYCYGQRASTQTSGSVAAIVWKIGDRESM
jgi:hypothetical protein